MTPVTIRRAGAIFHIRMKEGSATTCSSGRPRRRSMNLTRPVSWTEEEASV